MNRFYMVGSGEDLYIFIFRYMSIYMFNRLNIGYEVEGNIKEF